MKSVRRQASLVALMLALSVTPARGIAIDFVPTQQSVGLGEPVVVDIVVSGLGDFAAPSLSAFDLDVIFDPGVLAVEGVGFGAFLGEARLGEAISSFEVVAPGILDLFELSLLTGTDLNARQPSVFTLAIVTFRAVGKGARPLEMRIDGLADELARPLIATEGSAIVLVTAPSALVILASGLVGWLALYRSRLPGGRETLRDAWRRRLSRRSRS